MLPLHTHRSCALKLQLFQTRLIENPVEIDQIYRIMSSECQLIGHFEKSSAVLRWLLRSGVEEHCQIWNGGNSELWSLNFIKATGRKTHRKCLISSIGQSFPLLCRDFISGGKSIDHWVYNLQAGGNVRNCGFQILCVKGIIISIHYIITPSIV